MSGSALRITFARYALSAKAGLAPVFVSIFAQKGNKRGNLIGCDCLVAWHLMWCRCGIRFGVMFVRCQFDVGLVSA
ncbi:hypothetical protein CG397_01520 [Gardnerella vaginalis]|nr:hypothetical protein CG397_01520 [Gardnerella vaginalis]